MLTIVSFDGHFDLPQHLLTALADGRAQHADCRRRAEGKDICEVIRGEVFIRLQPTAGHECTGDADRCGVLESGLRAVFIIRFRKRSRKDVADIPGMFRPVFSRKPIRCRFNLACQSVLAGYVVIPFQHGRNAVPVFFPEFPELNLSGMGAGSGVGNVEDIPQPGIVAGCIDQGDTAGPFADIPSPAVVPKTVFGASGGIRPLRVDHELVMIGIFVQPCGGPQKRHPGLPAADDLCRGLACKLAVQLQFVGHGHSSFIKDKAGWRLANRLWVIL